MHLWMPSCGCQQASWRHDTWKLLLVQDKLTLVVINRTSAGGPTLEGQQEAQTAGSLHSPTLPHVGTAAQDDMKHTLCKGRWLLCTSALSDTCMWLNVCRLLALQTPLVALHSSRTLVASPSAATQRQPRASQLRRRHCTNALLCAWIMCLLTCWMATSPGPAQRRSQKHLGACCQQQHPLEWLAGQQWPLKQLLHRLTRLSASCKSCSAAAHASFHFCIALALGWTSRSLQVSIQGMRCVVWRLAYNNVHVLAKYGLQVMQHICSFFCMTGLRDPTKGGHALAWC